MKLRKVLNMSKLIKSIEKACLVIELFDTSEYELSNQEISEKLNLTKSTSYGIVKTLESRKYLIQNPINKKFMLGPRFLELGFFVGETFDIKKIASPHIQNVFDDVGET